MLLKDLTAITNYSFRILEKVSPKKASQKAARLWLTPPDYDVSQRELQAIQAAQIQVFSLAVNGNSEAEQLYTTYSWGSGPVVLLAHDWGGSAAQMAPLGQWLQKAGFHAIAFDAFGHGNSEGGQTHILEMAAIITDLSRRYNGVWGMVGHSAGALAAILSIQEGVAANRLVVSGAAASMDYYLRKFCGQIQVSRQTMGRMSHLLNTYVQRNLKDLSIINIVPTLNMPALIVHDKDDELISHSEAIALSKLWPGGEIRLSEGLGHDGVLTDDGVVDCIIDYLSREQSLRVDQFSPSRMPA